MALRRQVSDSEATYEDPKYGINLREAEENLRSGEARLMINCFNNGGTVLRTGSTRLTSASLNSSQRIRGGHKYYYGGASPTGKRLVAYGGTISVIANNGAETVLNTGMTSDLDTFFTTWSITDTAYIANNTDVIRKYDGTTFSTVSGTNIPVARTGVVPILDRLMCITTNGIERTDPRVDSIWSSNSSWATLRPIRGGLFTHIHPWTVRGTDTLYPGLIALQANAYYVVTGTDFGSSATAASPPTGEDSSIRLLDPNIGTSSPYSVETVPGVGMFWFTSDLNVYFLPEGGLIGRLIGENLRSTGSTAGIESCNTAAINQVVMRYFYPWLILGIPTGSDTWCSRYFLLDIRALTHPSVLGLNGPTIVWYGPMTGWTVSRFWAETQNGENALYGGEGKAANGAYVYTMFPSGTYTDAQGSTDAAVAMEYQTYFKGFGFPSREKYLREIHLDLNAYAGNPTVDVFDLDGAVISNATISSV